MQYTADELSQEGTPIKNPLIAGNTYTFTLYRPQNQTGLSTYLSGSGYFTFETIGDANRHYRSNATKFAEGTYGNQDGSNTLISSSYIFSYELNTNGSTPMTSSFTFVPDNTIGIGQVMFRATGDYDMDVSPIEPDSYPQASYSAGGDAVNDCGSDMFFTVYLELATPNIIAIGDVVHSSSNIGSGVIDGNNLFHRIQTGDGQDWNARFGADGVITEVNTCP